MVKLYLNAILPQKHVYLGDVAKLSSSLPPAIMSLSALP